LILSILMYSAMAISAERIITPQGDDYHVKIVIDPEGFDFFGYVEHIPTGYEVSGYEASGGDYSASSGTISWAFLNTLITELEYDVSEIDGITGEMDAGKKADINGIVASQVVDSDTSCNDDSVCSSGWSCKNGACEEDQQVALPSSNGNEETDSNDAKGSSVCMDNIKSELISQKSKLEKISAIAKILVSTCL